MCHFYELFALGFKQTNIAEINCKLLDDLYVILRLLKFIVCNFIKMITIICQSY